MPYGINWEVIGLYDARLAHSLPEETRVVFTTAFKEYAFESYEVNALDFLLKPIRYNKFLAAVEKAQKQHQQPVAPPPPQPNTVFIRIEGEWRNIAIDQITYVSGMKDYVLFYLGKEIIHIPEGYLPTFKSFLETHSF